MGLLGKSCKHFIGQIATYPVDKVTRSLNNWEQECRFDVKDGEVFKVLKKIGEKGHAFQIANERGQL